MAKFKTLEDEDIEYLHFAEGVYNDSNMPILNDAMVLAYDVMRCKGHTICWVIDNVTDLIGTRYVLQTLCYNKYLANGDRIYAIEYDYNPKSDIDHQIKYVCEVYDVNQLYSYGINKGVSIQNCKGIKCVEVSLDKPPAELLKIKGSDLPVTLIDIPPYYAFDSRTFYKLRMGAEYVDSLYNNNRPRRSNVVSPRPIPVEPKYKWKLWFGLSGVGLTEDDTVVELSRTFQEWINEIRSPCINHDIEVIKSKIDQTYRLPEPTKNRSCQKSELLKLIDDARSSNSAFLDLIDETLSYLDHI